MLNDGWRLHEEPLKWDKDFLSVVLNQKDGWYLLNLPADVRMPLLEANVIREPLKADYCFETEWIERRSWWFDKAFVLEKVPTDADIVELVLEGLDTRSDIFINGHYIGTHRSVHYPFVFDVKEFLLEGENHISARITSGLEEITEQDVAGIDYIVSMESYNGREGREDNRRSYVRRPQYTCGWDWGPKVTTIGITGDVYLRSCSRIAVRDVAVEVQSINSGVSGRDAVLKAAVNIEDLSLIGSKECELSVKVAYEGNVVAEVTMDRILLTSGTNVVEADMTIPEAKLWWPNGYGEQPLYEVYVSASCEGKEDVWPAFRYGIRLLELDTAPLDEKNRKFQFKVNGKPIYCKGGNWVPNDFIYARVPDEKYHVLTDEAKDAHFTMMRIWGGGLYERELFYDLCDEKGILIWQDLMFACSTHPDHLDWFKDLMRNEIDYQTKRLRNHCCMGIICGTNELHWIFNPIDNPTRFDGADFTHNEQHGLYIANIMAKEIIRQNCPGIPYWNSSPYGGERPNFDEVGDIHFWRNAYMSKDMNERIEFRNYDKIGAKFVSEYGYCGPCSLETTLEYMDGQPLDRDGSTWYHHTNIFEKGTTKAGIVKNYVDHPETLSMEDYINYGGMVHSLMYNYSLESMRFKEHCYGGLIWMFNDAWGEEGWTIVDYYLRRKIPFYGVKRALANVKFTMRIVDGKVVLQGINDTDKPVSLKGRFGYVSFDGKTDKTREVSFDLEAFGRNYLLEEEIDDDLCMDTGTFVIYSETEGVASAWLLTKENRYMKYESSDVRVVHDESVNEDRVLTLTADGFVHGVYVEGGYHCDDNYFDLLPGEMKTITVKGAGQNKLEIKKIR